MEKLPPERSDREGEETDSSAAKLDSAFFQFKKLSARLLQVSPDDLREQERAYVREKQKKNGQS